MLRVGLVGCGTIGGALARSIDRQYRHVARLTAVHDVNRAHAEALARTLRSRPAIVALPTLIRRAQLILEAASAEVVLEVVSRALRLHRDVMVMSVGGLLRTDAWRRLAERSRGRLYIPSGALSGLDGVKAMAAGTIRRLSLTTRKPPDALAGAPSVRARKLTLSRLRRPTLLFEGSPRQVVRAFPQNTNVAAALALAAGAAGRRARIRVIADPTIRFNIHEVEVEGDCGRMVCRIQSRPSRNPKTSELAIRSAMATLRRIIDPVAIGT